MKEKLIRIIKQTGIILLLMITYAMVLTSLLYLVKVSITKFHLPIALILAILTMFFLPSGKKDKKEVFISSSVAIIIILISILFTWNTYDLTADGNCYHKLAIGSLKNGWNPVYENNEDFGETEGNVFDVNLEGSNNSVWTNHYAKGNWIFSANVYKLTDNIETGKIINILIAYICFALVFSYLSEKLGVIRALIISVLLVVNPITVVQTMNYYVDGIIGLSIFIIIYALINITNKNHEISKIEEFLILACSIIICVNIKFTGLVFAAMFCFVFYIYWLVLDYREDKEKFKQHLWQYTVFYVVVVVIAVLIVGASSYVKNLIEHGHPFYPLFGEGKYDIITTMQPNYFSERNVIQKFLISMFSKGENITYSWNSEGTKPILKIPFTYTEDELNQYTIPDIRIGGFGVLFSGIFILSCIGYVYMLVQWIRKKEYKILIPSLLIMGVIGVLILIVDGSWWARYTPYLYLLPIMVLVYFWENKEQKVKIVLGSIFAILITINVLLLLNVTNKNYKKNYDYIDNALEAFEEYLKESKGDVEIKLNSNPFESIQYNLKDKGIDVDTNSNKETTKEGYFFTY